MVDIKGLVPGQDPATPVSELRIELDPAEVQKALEQVAAEYNVPVRMLMGQPGDANAEAAARQYLSSMGPTQHELNACRTHWEVTQPGVPFPDYWVGWNAAKQHAREELYRRAWLASEAIADLVTAHIEITKLHAENAKLLEAIETLNRAYGKSK